MLSELGVVENFTAQHATLVGWDEKYCVFSFLHVNFGCLPYKEAEFPVQKFYMHPPIEAFQGLRRVAYAWKIL